MRILALETSSRRGSVALVEDGRLVLADAHERPHSHAEELLPRVAALIDRAGWSRGSLRRVGVGVGPGSFTGLRVGLALAQGIALGLGIPVVGVGSLEAMARGLPASFAGVRWPILDARRGEVFCAGYDPDGTEVAAPRAVARGRVLEVIAAAAGTRPYVLLGEVARELGAESRGGPECDLPHAAWVGRIAGEIEPSGAPVRPRYVREPDAIEPALPPHPLLNQRES